jgi:hypothetical protein
MGRTTFAGMKFAMVLIVSSLAAVSLPATATADKEIIREAIHDAVAAKPSEPQTPPAQRDDSKSRDDSNARDVAEQVVVNGKSASGHRHHEYDGEHDADDCTTLASCPFGSLGTLTFDQVRNLYRNYPESELWNICLGRRAAPYPGGSKDACMLLGSPNPLRPVDVPHSLERVDNKAGSDGSPPCKGDECASKPAVERE